MQTFFKSFAIIVFAAVSSFAQAATVTIVVDGTMSDLTGSDNYGVDGTSAQFELIYDTAATNVGSGVLTGFGNYAHFDAVSAELTVNGELYALNTSGLISASNNHISGTDSIATACCQTLGGSGALAGLIMGDFVFELVPTVFPGTGIPVLPSLTNADISTTFAPIFEEDFTFDGQYEFVLQGLSVTTVVPVPAAVWLFGSALAGLGLMRSRKTSWTKKGDASI